MSGHTEWTELQRRTLAARRREQLVDAMYQIRQRIARDERTLELMQQELDALEQARQDLP